MPHRTKHMNLQLSVLLPRGLTNLSQTINLRYMVGLFVQLKNKTCGKCKVEGPILGFYFLVVVGGLDILTEKYSIIIYFSVKVDHILAHKYSFASLF